jgi:hypothetical protein
LDILSQRVVNPIPSTPVVIGHERRIDHQKNLVDAIEGEEMNPLLVQTEG